MSSAAEDSRDVVGRAEDLCHNQGGSRTEQCGHFCGDATTGACDSESKENGGYPTASVHCHDRRCRRCEGRREGQHEDCTKKYNEIKIDGKLRSA